MESSKEKIASLRLRCHELGLDTSGDRACLQARLNEQDGGKKQQGNEEKVVISDPDVKSFEHCRIPSDVVAMILSFAIETPSEYLSSILVCKRMRLKLFNDEKVWKTLFREDCNVLSHGNPSDGGHFDKCMKVIGGKLIKRGDEDDEDEEIIPANLTLPQRRDLTAASYTAKKLCALMSKDKFYSNESFTHRHLGYLSDYSFALLGDFKTSVVNVLKGDESVGKLTLGNMKLFLSELIEDNDDDDDEEKDDEKQSLFSELKEKLTSFSPALKCAIGNDGANCDSLIDLIYFEEKNATGIVIIFRSW
jgi:hypothetical protein